MASKQKKTPVKQQYLAACPSIPLRILAFLLSRSSYSRDAAIKITTIARELCIDTEEVKFDCYSLCAPGFAVLELSSIAVDHKTTAVYIETNPKVIHDHGITLECRAAQVKGRATYMKRCARAVAVACHPWSDLAAPASSRSAG